MKFDTRFLDDLRHRISLSDVVGRGVKLVRRGREYTGLCPFHSEKTPSFTVNDEKGFYHCFGCGAHGDVVSYVVETQGLSFPEAVEQLAGQAGMELPKFDPRSQEKAEQRASLSDVMAVVVNWYKAQLSTGRAEAARRYLSGRGLKANALEAYGIGYAPSARTALKDAMLARRVREEDLIALGMLIKPEDDGESYDRFRDRIMFPIQDKKGAPIAFGGRALSPDAKAKYLNSPETSLFHKGHTLYNWHRARRAAFEAGQVLVVEGYMDVIALGEYGIDYAVAPLGTALTEDQIQLLWQMADEPVLAFDGDNAGLRAAGRAAVRALPLLRAGKSLRFIFMPEGDDPDTLVRKSGRSVIDKLIEGGEPLVSFMWRLLTEGEVFDTPERRAGLEKKIFSELSRIEDEAIKNLYQRDYRSRLWELGRASYSRKAQDKRAGRGAQGGFGNSGSAGKVGGGRRQGGYGYSDGATSALKATALGQSGRPARPKDLMQKLLLLTALHHVDILARFEDVFVEMDINDPAIASLRDAMTNWMVTEGAGDGKQSAGTSPPAPELGAEGLDVAGLKTHLEGLGYMSIIAALEKQLPVRVHWAAYSSAALSDALIYFEHALARYRFATTVQRDYEQAQEECASNMTEENYARLLSAQQALQALDEKQASIEGFGLESNRYKSN